MLRQLLWPLFLVLLVVPQSTATTDVCIALRAAAGDIASPDGLSGSAFSSLDWVGTKCDANAKDGSVSYDSDWVPADSSALSFNLPAVPDAALTGASVRRSLSATISSGKVDFTITVAFKGAVSGQVTGGPKLNGVQLSGSVTKKASGLPVDAVSHLRLPWSGALTPVKVGGSGPGLSDANLFDGTPAAVVDKPVAAPAPLQPLAASVADVAGDPNRRMDALDATASSAALSVRGAFLTADALPAPTGVGGGVYYDGGLLASGYLAQASASCEGSSCPPAVEAALRDVALAGTKDCADAVLVTIGATLDVDVFVSADAVVPRGLGATSHALFHCPGAKGYVGASLTSRAPVGSLSPFPSHPFSTGDYQAAVALIQGMPVARSGILSGALSPASGLTTLLPADIFSSARGGVWVKDAAVTVEDKANVKTVLAALKTAFSTKIAPLDEVVGAFFDTDTVLPAYCAQTTAPTALGFFFWLQQRAAANGAPFPALTVLPSATGGDVTVVATLALSSVPLTSGGDAGAQGINAAMADLAAAVKQHAPDAAAPYTAPTITAAHLKDVRFSGSMTASAVVKSVAALASGGASVAAGQAPVAYGSLSVDGSFSGAVGNSTSMFDRVVATYDYHAAGGGAAVHSAALPAPLHTAVGAAVALDATGALLVDKEFGTPAALAAGAGKVADGLTGLTWMDGNLAPLAFSAGRVSPGSATATATYHGVMKDVQAVLAKATAGSALALAAQVEAVFTDAAADGTQVVVRVLPDAAATALSVTASVYTVAVPSVARDYLPWAQTADTTRLAVPVATVARFSCSISSTDGTLGDVTVKGGAKVSGWTMPVVYGMRAGWAGTKDAEATLSATINLPDRAVLNISAGVGTPENAPGLSVVLNADLTGSEAATFAVQTAASGYDGMDVIAPAAALAAVRDGMLPLAGNILGGPLNVPMPPLATSLQGVHGFDDGMARVLPWLTTPSASFPLLAASTQLTLPVAAFSQKSLITINSWNVSCTIASSGASSLTDLAADVDTQLAKCGSVGQYVGAVAQFGHEDGTGQIVIQPKHAGMVWQFKIHTEEEGAFFSDRAYADRGIPSFASWEDLPKLLYSALPRLLAAVVPALKPIDLPASALQGIVPEELRSVYPAKLPGVIIPFTTVYTQKAMDIEMSRDITASHGGASFSLEGGSLSGHVATSLEGGLGFTASGPPRAADGNITVQTCFDADTPSTDVKVPAAPNNTFTLRIRAEKRSAKAVDTPVLVDVTHKVTLTPGALLKDALLSVPKQINEPSLVATVVPADPIAMTVEQVELTLVRRKLDADTWQIPTTLAVGDVGMPGLQAATNTPQTMLVFTRGLRIGAEAVLDAKAPTGKGSLGIVNVEAKGAEGKTNISLSISTVEDDKPLAALLTAANVRDRFFSSFAVHFAVDSTTTMGDLTVGLDHVDLPGPLPSVSFSINNAWPLASLDDLTQLAKEELNKWETKFEGVAAPVEQAYHALTATRNHSVCEVTTLIQNTLEDVVNNPLVQKALPFTSKTYSRLLSSVVGKVYTDVHEAACTANEPFDLAVFCAVWKDVYGHDVCRNRIINKNSLKFDLHVVPFSREWSDALHFDPTLFANTDLPIGVSSSSTLSFLADFSFNLGVVVEFGGPHGLDISVRLEPGSTYISVGTMFDVTGNLDARFGTIKAPFTKAHGYLGSVSSPANLTVHLSSSGVSLTVGGSAGLEAVVSFGPSSQCPMSVTVPDVGKFLAGTPPTVTDCPAQGGFIKCLEDAVEKSRVFDFFSDPSLFLNSWSEGIADLVKQFFGPGGQLEKMEVAFIGKLINKIASKELTALAGPEVSKEVVAELSQMATDVLIRHKHITPDEVDVIVLQLFTGIICKVFKGKLLECPDVPAYPSPDGEYTWALPFGRTTPISVKAIDFDLGGRGIAELAMDCQETMTLEWKLTVALTFSRSKGVSLTFPEEEVYYADVNLAVSDPCQLSGRIGFLGAEVLVDSASTGLDGHFAITKKPDGGSWGASFKFDAKLGGEADLGLAGPIAEKVSKSPDAIKALPHFKTTLQFEWALDAETGMAVTTPHLFKVTKPMFCIGQLLAQVGNHFLGQTLKVLDPLKPVLGPDGILLKPIPGLSKVFGHNLNLITLCRRVCAITDDCHVGGMLKALDAVARVYNQVEGVARIGIADPEGCGILQQIQDFIVDLKKGAPIPDGTIPDKDLLYMTEPAKHDMKFISSFYKSVTTDQPPLGLRVNIFEDLPGKIVSLMLGENIALMGVTIPDASITVMATWHIPIWAVPYVEINVGISGSLGVSVGEIALTSEKSLEAVKTGHIGLFFESIAIESVNEDGSPHWHLTGSVRLTGGVTVSVFIFEGSASVWIEMDAMVRVVNVNGDRWVTFGQLGWMVKHYGVIGSLDRKLMLRAGFDFYIRACIKIPFVHHKKCWKIVSIHTSTTLWQKEWKPKPIAPIATPDGQVHTSYAGNPVLLGDGLEGSSPPIFTFASTSTGETNRNPATAPTSVVFQPAGADDGYMPLSRDVLPRSSTFSPEAAPAVPFTYAVGYTNNLVVLPATDGATLRYSQKSYAAAADASTFSVSASTVASSGVDGSSVPGVSVQKCKTVHLDDPVEFAKVSLSGLACPAAVSTADMAAVGVYGHAADYHGHPVQVTGDAFHVTAAVQITNISVATSSVRDAAMGMDINFPESVGLLHVNGHSTADTTFFLEHVPAARSVSCLGGAGNDFFMINPISVLEGTTRLDGGGGDNVFNLTIRTKADQDLQVVSSSSSLLVLDGDASPTGVARYGATADQAAHTLLHTNIFHRSFFMHGAPSRTSSFTLFSPEEYAVVDVFMHGHPEAVMNQYTAGCDGKSVVRVHMDDGGNQTVSLGRNGLLSDLACVFEVFGSTNPNQTDTIVITGHEEMAFMMWDVSEGTLLVYDHPRTRKALTVIFENIDQLVIQAGKNGNTVNLNAGTPGTEVLVSFPEIPHDEDRKASTVNVLGTTDSVFINGTLDTVNLGGPPSAVPPFDAVAAPIYLNVSPNVLAPVAVLAKSGSGKGSPAQAFFMNQVCLDPMKDGAIEPVLFKPSRWMKGMLLDVGFPYPVPACHFAYNGDIDLTITTGPANDAFTGVNVSASVSLHLEEGDDYVSWHDVSSPRGSALFDVASGADYIELGTTAAVIAELGDDNDVDTIKLTYPPGRSPTINGNLIRPVGPYGGSRDSLTAHLFKQEDTMAVIRNDGTTIPDPVTSVGIRWMFPGTLEPYQLDSETDYHVTYCARQSRIHLDGRAYANPNAARVFFGDGHMSGLSCYANVTGSANRDQDDTIIFAGQVETDVLNWTLRDSTIAARHGSDSLKVDFQSVQRIVLNAGLKDNAITLEQGTKGTEYAFVFPDANTGASSVSLHRVTNAVLVNGTLDTVNVGGAPSAVPSFDGMAAPIYVTATPEPSRRVHVNVVQGSGLGAPAQDYQMNDVCFDPVVKGKVPPVPVKPSKWMQGLLKGIGFAAPPECHLAYRDAIALHLATGDEADSFTGTSVSVPVSLSLNSGDDTVTWTKATSKDAAATFDVGMGADTVTIDSAADVVVRLGDDTDHDSIVVWYEPGHPPSIDGDNVAPIGPYPGFDALTTEQYHTEDTTDIKRHKPSALSNAVEAGDEEGDNPVVTINWSHPSVLDYILDSDIDYKVVGCAAEATIRLNGLGDKDDEPAKNIGVAINLPTLAVRNAVHLLAVPASNARLSVDLGPSSSSAATSPAAVAVAAAPAGAADGHVVAGGLNVTARGVAHVAVVHTGAAVATPLAITVDGTPSAADLVVALPAAGAARTLDVAALDSHLLAVSAAATVPAAVVRGNRTVVAVGAASDTHIDCIMADEARFVAGCLQLSSAAPSAPFSAWFVGQLAAFGVDAAAAAAASSCSVYTHRAAALRLANAPTVVAAGLDGNYTVAALALETAGASLVLDPPLGLRPELLRPWAAAAISGANTLTVDGGRFQVSGQMTSVEVPTARFAAAATLDIAGCGGDGLGTHWNLSATGGDIFTDASPAGLALQWTGSACTGTLSHHASVDPAYTPAVTLDTAARASAWAVAGTRYQADGARYVELNPTSILFAPAKPADEVAEDDDDEVAAVGMAAVDGATPFVSVTWAEPEAVTSLAIAIKDATANSIRVSGTDVDEKSTAATLTLGQDASASLAVDRGFSVLTASGVDFDAKTSFLTPDDRGGAHCLEVDACRDTAWAKSQVLGGGACVDASLARVCTTGARVILETEFDLRCEGSTSDTWALAVRPPPDAATPAKPPPAFPVVAAVLWFYLAVVVACAEVAALGEFRDRAAWTRMVLTAGLVKMGTDNFPAMAVVASASRVASNMWMQCEAIGQSGGSSAVLAVCSVLAGVAAILLVVNKFTGKGDGDEAAAKTPLMHSIQSGSDDKASKYQEVTPVLVYAWRTCWAVSFFIGAPLLAAHAADTAGLAVLAALVLLVHGATLSYHFVAERPHHLGGGLKNIVTLLQLLSPVLLAIVGGYGVDMDHDNFGPFAVAMVGVHVIFEVGSLVVLEKPRTGDLHWAMVLAIFFSGGCGFLFALLVHGTQLSAGLVVPLLLWLVWVGTPPIAWLILHRANGWSFRVVASASNGAPAEEQEYRHHPTERPEF